MQLKVIHLFNYFQKLEQEQEEIETFKSNVQDSRSYSSRLRLALHEELQGLRTMQNKVLAQVIKDPPPLLQKDINQADIKKNETATIVETLATEQIGANSKYNWPQEPALSFVKQSQPAPNIAQQKTNATKPKPRAPEAKSLTTKANTHDKDSNSKLQTASIIATADNTKSDVEQSKIKASAPLAKDEFRFRFDDT